MSQNETQRLVAKDFTQIHNIDNNSKHRIRFRNIDGGWVDDDTTATVRRVRFRSQQPPIERVDPPGINEFGGTPEKPNQWTV